MSDKTLSPRYELIKKIGQGAYGYVYKALDRRGRTIALKVMEISMSNKVLIEQTEKEVRILQDLTAGCEQHFIICYYGSYYDEEQELFYIEMEYIEGEDLYEFLQRNKLSDEMRYYYLLLFALDVSVGLKYIHSKGYVHNDIKLDNIMIDKNTGVPKMLYKPKIIDFGLSCKIEKGKNSCVYEGGTPDYIPPEYFRNNGERSPESDMWALGVTLFAGATLKPGVIEPVYPFDMDNIQSEVLQPESKYPRLKTSNDLLNRITNNLIIKNPYERLTPDQVIRVIDRNLVRPEKYRPKN